MSEQIYLVRKLTAVPTTPTTPHTIFYVTPANSNYLEIYVSNMDGSVIKRSMTENDIKALISAQASNSGKVQVVADITARNALADKTTLVYVKNATGDTTVKSGGASYIYDTNAWVKISEFESMDLSFDWADIKNKPNSSASAIDSAVTNNHNHANKTQLDLIGQDSNGNLTYNSKLVAPTINDAW